MQAFRSATIDAAELVGRQKNLGAVGPGRYVDTIAVDGDVLIDIDLLTRVAAVTKGGRLVD